MTPNRPGNVTELLQRWGQGDQQSFNELMPIIYEELRRLARSHVRRERAEHTLQTTALVNEAYLRLVDQREENWENRKQFYCIAARMMRRILIDHARRKKAGKRGGGIAALSLDQVHGVADKPAAAPVDCVAMHDALTALESLDPRQGQLVELKVFGGRTQEEVARILGVSLSTVKREWTAAKAWLRRELAAGQTYSPDGDDSSITS